MKLRSRMVVLAVTLAAGMLVAFRSYAQSHSGMPPISRPPMDSPPAQQEISTDALAEAELQKGTALTSKGSFPEAIPHLLSARGKVRNEYALSFNLALCYVATSQSGLAIPMLNNLRAHGHDTADVDNLLAQAYVGDSQDKQALDALRRAAALNPSNEKLFTFVADACTSKENYPLGLQVTDLGLSHLPNSARLHFERAMFLSSLDQFDKAKKDFELARKLAPDSDIAFVAAAQEAMLAGDVAEALRAAREGVTKGHENFMLLTLLGEALLRSGAVPGESQFDEAQNALEKAVSERVNYPSAQLSLGKLYLTAGRFADAIAHLEIARQLNPSNTAIYSNLAAAYRKQGKLANAQEVLATLARLNEMQAEKIRNAPADRKAGYSEADREPRQ